MNESGPPIAGSPTVRGQKPHLQPGLVAAWGAIWLFTWKGQLTWLRTLRTLARLMALPLLFLLVVRSPQHWSPQGELRLGDLTDQMNRVIRRMMRSGIALNTNQTEQIREIFSSEQERTQKDYLAITTPEIAVEQQRALIHACYARITERVRPLLTSAQAAQFDGLQNEFVSNAESHIGESSWNRTAPFYHLLIEFYFFMVLPFSCVWACGGLIRDELQSDTLGFLTTRPIKRASLVTLKYFAQVTWLEIVTLVQGLLLMSAGVVRHIPGLGALAALFLAVQFLAVLAWSALGLLLGQITKRYLPMALVYGLIVELGIGDIPTNINTLSLMRHLRALLSHNQELQSIYDWSATGVLLPVGALLAASALFVTVAALLFTFREYHSNTEMQK